MSKVLMVQNCGTRRKYIHDQIGLSLKKKVVILDAQLISETNLLLCIEQSGVFLYNLKTERAKLKLQCAPINLVYFEEDEPQCSVIASTFVALYSVKGGLKFINLLEKERSHNEWYLSHSNPSFFEVKGDDITVFEEKK